MLLGLDGKAVTAELIAAELEKLDAVYRKRKRALRALLVLLKDETKGQATIPLGDVQAVISTDSETPQ